MFVISAQAKEKEKQNGPGATEVDSGSFGVFTSGQRIATEKFSIKQGPEGSIVSSEFKSAQGASSAEQSSELHLTAGGELRQYEWKESSPEKMTASVEPADAFLIEKFTNGVDAKEHDQNFLLSSNISILDDFAFVQREVLAWKYLATACKKESGPVQCPLKQKVLLGTLNPHARSSMSVGIEFMGRDKITYHGAPQDFSRFVLSAETGDWVFWLDDHFKLVRLLNDSGTEVVRD
jgi:hypothetical protein